MLTSQFTLLGAGVALIVAGLALRDIAQARHQPAMAAWRIAWKAVASSPRPLRGIEDAQRVASIVGDPNASTALLTVLAHDISSQEWIPSDRLLDQLRLWAHSQLVAEHALRPGPDLQSSPTHPRTTGRTEGASS